MHIGEIDVCSIIDGTSRVEIAQAMARDGDWVWDCADQPVDADGTIAMDVGGYLLRTSGRVVLIDLGAGPVNKPHVQSGALLDGLLSRGLRPDEVTDILFTHLHFDHVGWSTQDGLPVFANATHHVHALDWAQFVTSHAALPGAVRKLRPIAPLLRLFDADGEILPGIVAEHAPGHSPGSTVFHIRDGGQAALILGDVVHVIPELTDPAWTCLYDMAPEEARATRNRILDAAARNGTLVTASHLPGLGFGRLRMVDGARHLEWSA